jgi:ankyrin repeat protein
MGVVVGAKAELGVVFFSDLHMAAMRGDLFRIGKLIKSKAIPIDRSLGPDRTSSHLTATPLHVAIKHNRTKAVTLLLELGADPNVTDPILQTPLHYAAWRANVAIVSILIANGATIDARDKAQRTPLHLLLSDSRFPHDDNHHPFAIFRLLISAGANVSAIDSLRLTVWHCAAHRPHAAVTLVALDRAIAASRVKLPPKDIWDKTPTFLYQTYRWGCLKSPGTEAFQSAMGTIRHYAPRASLVKKAAAWAAYA